MTNDTKRDFDGDAAAWDEKPGRVRVARDIFNAIAGEINLNVSMDVLDFGCGTGLLTLQLQPLVRFITGLDSSQGMLDVLNAKIEKQNLTNIKTRFFDIESSGVLEGSYHLITSSMTFHHIRNIGPVLENFYQALLPGGRICIADLDIDGGLFHENNDGVFHSGFQRDELSRLAADTGFKDVKCLTAATVTKPVWARENRRFTIFLLTGYRL